MCMPNRVEDGTRVVSVIDASATVSSYSYHPGCLSSHGRTFAGKRMLCLASSISVCAGAGRN